MVVTGADRSDARAEGASEQWTNQLAGPLLLVAATAGLLGQGAYYPSMQWPVGLLTAAATLVALVAWPLTSDDLREIDRAASRIEVHGARYPEHLQQMVGR